MLTRLCRWCQSEMAVGGQRRRRMYCTRYCREATYRAKRRLERQPRPGTREEALADLAGGCLGALEALCRAVSEGHCPAEVVEAAAHARREVGALVARAEALMPGVSKGKGARAC